MFAGEKARSDAKPQPVGNGLGVTEDLRRLRKEENDQNLPFPEIFCIKSVTFAKFLTSKGDGHLQGDRFQRQHKHLSKWIH